MSLDAILNQPIQYGKFNYIHETDNADATSLKSLLSGAGFPANDGESLANQVRRFQTAQGITVDGMAGPETLGTLRGVLQQPSETPTSLSDKQAEAFISSPGAVAKTATADEIARGPSSGQTRVSCGPGSESGARAAVERALDAKTQGPAAKTTAAPAAKTTAAATTTAPAAANSPVASSLSQERKLFGLQQELDLAKNGDPGPASERLVDKLNTQISGVNKDLNANPMTKVIADQRADQKSLKDLDSAHHFLPSEEERAKIATQRKSLTDAIAQRKTKLGDVNIDAPNDSTPITADGFPKQNTPAATGADVLKAESRLKNLNEELRVAQHGPIDGTMPPSDAAQTRLVGKIQDQITSTQKALNDSPTYAKVLQQRKDVQQLNDLKGNGGLFNQAWTAVKSTWTSGATIADQETQGTALASAIAKRKQELGVDVTP